MLNIENMIIIYKLSNLEIALSEEHKLSNLDAHIKDSLSAIQLLCSDGYYQQARYCAFILIDQMAWLASDNNEKVSDYFKSWANKYFVPLYPEISAEELLASRNGLLHRGSSISQSIEKGYVARQLWFVDNLSHLHAFDHSKVDGDSIFYAVNSDKFLQVAFLGAINKFREDLESLIQANHHNFEKRLGELLQNVPMK